MLKPAGGKLVLVAPILPSALPSGESWSVLEFDVCGRWEGGSFHHTKAEAIREARRRRMAYRRDSM